MRAAQAGVHGRDSARAVVGGNHQEHSAQKKERCMKKLCVVLFVLLLPTLAFAVQATVNWVDASADETGFKVERSTDGQVTWVIQSTTAANVTSFNQAGLTLGTQYCYRIIAFNGFGDAAASNVACGTPATPLPASGVVVIFAP